MSKEISAHNMLPHAQVTATSILLMKSEIRQCDVDLRVPSLEIYRSIAFKSLELALTLGGPPEPRPLGVSCAGVGKDAPLFEPEPRSDKG